MKFKDIKIGMRVKAVRPYDDNSKIVGKGGVVTCVEHTGGNQPYVGGSI